MTWQQLVMDIFERIERQLGHILEGLTPDELNKQPAPDANTIGWLTWHLTRSHDRNMSELINKEQLWTADGWYARFGREPNPAETGVGHTPKEVAAFRAPDSETIIKYYRAVVERIRGYVENDLTEADLDKESYSPTFDTTRPALQVITGVINDGLQHLGQAAYVRGLIKGQGWLGR